LRRLLCNNTAAGVENNSRSNNNKQDNRFKVINLIFKPKLFSKIELGMYMTSLCRNANYPANLPSPLTPLNTKFPKVLSRTHVQHNTKYVIVKVYLSLFSR